MSGLDNISILAFWSAFERLSEFFKFLNVPVVKLIAAFVSTSQCVTSILFVPAWKNALAKPDNPSPLGVPSSEAVLHADNIMTSDCKFNFSIDRVLDNNIQKLKIKKKELNLKSKKEKTDL